MSDQSARPATPIKKHRPNRQGRRRLTSDDVTVVEESQLKRAVAAAALGNGMEWFDFGVFAYLTTTLAKVFYPSLSPTLSVILTFATFTAAFIVRPIGGAVFGPLGDRIGRQKVLAVTMIMMAAGTFAIGFLPDFNTIGVWAPLLLLLARLVQGFSTGGEYGGAATFIAEYSPDKRRGFMGSWLEFGTLGGYVLGASLVTVLQFAMPEDTLLSWGWRIPFLVAGPLGLVGLYLRLKLEETPAFQKQQEEAAEREHVKVPFIRLFAENWRALIVCIGLVLVFNVTDYMLLSYMPTYLTSTLGRDATNGLILVIVVMVLMMAVISMGGRLSDRFGRRPVLFAGCIGFLVLSWPALKLVQSESTPLVFVGLLILGLVLVTFTSTMPSTLPALFPTIIRYGALAIAFNVSVSLFGGTTPLVTESLVAWATSNGYSWANDIPAFYLMIAAVIGLVAVWFTKESANVPLLGSGPSVATEEEAEELIAAYADESSEVSKSEWAVEFAMSGPIDIVRPPAEDAAEASSPRS
ncbi:MULTISPECIES: glycine betaine/L-proline transporter ProP [unclassified Frondihabitans]|uniref:glycine betaine/L-proline transporter ProP n=2 Tax=unclassified Frondihabitans TaxID=2626248 RepID=UPI000F4E4150|nr:MULTISPECIES: glycine betaine/L-proline transporter ProP [unclassified Frondihabitans]RPE76487.1 MHS family proline/betaine transporter-like MFS transporter [Frondihabitans sp. PhB153]RPF05238.1 MHS family proline/betaine transporter-like MFS transporter [Frondihabitans sp. PhB161]